MFDVIYKSEFAKECFDLIESKQDEFNYFADHGYNHAMDVLDLSIRLANLANLEKYIEEVKIAALLHDVGNIYGKDNHAENSYIMVKDYFNKANLVIPNKDLVLDAIRNHGGKTPTDNPICKIITIADKLDVTKKRVRKLGMSEIGIRQFHNIDKIDISIVDNTIVFNFITNELFDKNEFIEYYFYKKIVSAINEYGNFINKVPVICYNGVEEK